jgi:ubiquinone/menaquinone biosynthesis C-methylase UbiE
MDGTKTINQQTDVNRKTSPRMALDPPIGYDELPSYEVGWSTPDGRTIPFLSYVADSHDVKWSNELEELHEESSREHFIDVWTRAAMLSRIPPPLPPPVIADLGCSTGYLLENLRTAYPDATLIGVDLIASGLRKAHANVPDAYLVQADLCDLPFVDDSLDAVVSANVLEHVPDDCRALAEICRVLKPGAGAVLVVPSGPGLYDYYDRFLGHERRYGIGELARKAEAAGLDVLEDIHLGSVLYPAFWLVKQRNRRRYDHLRDAALEARVAADIEQTQDSRVGHLACGLERVLLDRGVRLPFGIRNLIVARRPAGT